eukprot:scaffold659268_cov85-Prasinocladus_malaysianus.AAC.1
MSIWTAHAVPLPCLVEVGYCVDLRLNAKGEEEMSKYAPLMTELRKLWKDGALVVVPVGGDVTTLEVTATDLNERFYKDPDS